MSLYTEHNLSSDWTKRIHLGLLLLFPPSGKGIGENVPANFYLMQIVQCDWLKQ